jgi:2-isopropylmalate synthase
VRILNGNSGTDSITRVTISSSDGKNIWTTIGVSQDIIEASFIALVDSLEYKLNQITEKGE